MSALGFFCWDFFVGIIFVGNNFVGINIEVSLGIILSGIKSLGIT